MNFLKVILRAMFRILREFRELKVRDVRMMLNYTNWCFENIYFPPKRQNILSSTAIRTKCVHEMVSTKFMKPKFKVLTLKIFYWILEYFNLKIFCETFPFFPKEIILDTFSTFYNKIKTTFHVTQSFIFSKMWKQNTISRSKKILSARIARGNINWNQYRNPNGISQPHVVDNFIWKNKF